MSVLNEPAPSRAAFATRPGIVLVAIWAVIAAALVAGHRPVAECMSTDDLMRLVQVRDLLGGQGWFDLAQKRLDPPGVALHWSRVLDLPLAAAVAAFAPAFGQAQAEALVATAWPVLLLLPTLWLAAELAARLGGAAARLPALLLLAMSVPLLTHFRPGGLDHHGAQIALVLAAALGAAAARGERKLAVLGGLAAAMSLAVGVESVPALAALIVGLGLRWVVGGARETTAPVDFGAAFALGSAVLFVATVPPSHWAAPVCDALSTPWLLAAVLGGGALALLPVFAARLASARARAAAGMAIGGAVLAVLWLWFPHCYADPYGALDPRLTTLWLAQVMEAQSLVGLARVLPADILPLYAPPLVALALAARALVCGKAPEQPQILPVVAAFGALFALSLWQMRAAAGALALAAPVIAAALTAATSTAGRTRARALAALVAVSYPALSFAGQGMAHALVRLDPLRPVVADDGRRACRRPEDFAALAALPAGRVLATIDLGPAILAHTPHAVLAAPYHRNVAGNLAALDALLGDDAAVRRVVTAKGVRYVALCARGPERRNLARAASAGLSARLERGDIPSGLVPLSAPASALRVFVVIP